MKNNFKLTNDVMFIITRLLIPLIVIIIFLCGLNFYFFATPNDLVTNIITDLMAILISAVFVSWVYNEHQKRIWKESETKIKDRIQFLINLYNSYIRDWLGYSSDFENICKKTLDPKDTHEINKLSNEFAKKILLDFDERSKDNINWVLLFDGAKAYGVKDDGLKHVERFLDKILTRYNNKISPELFSRILDMENSIYLALRYYEAFPKIFTNPDLSNTYQNVFRDSVSSDLKIALEATIIIYENINSLNE